MELAFRKLRADEIDIRAAQVSEKGASLLLYKDARCDMNILDETVGPMNWTRQHSRDNANCTVSLWDDDKKMWIGKEDTGTESNTEAEKGIASDSFKRACFNWGIGRELYTAPFIWVPASVVRIEKNYKGKFEIKDKLCVSEIEYENNRIISLVIKTSKGTDVYTWRKNGGSTKPNGQQSDENPMSQQPNVSTEHVCADCGHMVTDYITKTGVTKADELVRKSRETYGRCLCGKCSVAESRRRNGGGRYYDERAAQEIA